MNDIDLSTNACCDKLNISNSTFYEIKYRLGYRNKINLEQFNEIEKVVLDIRRRYGMVALGTINRYWEYMKKGK